MTRLNKRIRSLVIVAAALTLSVSAIGWVTAGSSVGASPAQAATAMPTRRPTATATKAPAATATPTKKPGATATPAPKVVPTATRRPEPTPANGVTIQPINKVSSVKSYKTLMNLKLDGKSEGKAAKGDLNAEVQSNVVTKRQSIGLSGSLIPVLLGKYLQGVPVNGLTVYLIDNKIYVVAQALILKVCAVPGKPIAGLDQLSSGLSAESFLSQITGGNKIYGTLVGEETVNGIPSKHYKLDVTTMNALAKKNGANVQLKAGDAWVAKQGDYVVRLLTDGTGNLAAGAGVDFNGNANVALNVSDVNKIQDIVLPGQCNNPIKLP